MVKRKSNDVIVSTGDINKSYEIIGPVYSKVTNKGLFSSELSRLLDKHKEQLDKLKNSNQISEKRRDWGFMWGEWSAGQNDFDKAFFVAVQELKERASLVGGNGIIFMRQDIDLDTNAFQYFYLQMYGTAVKINTGNKTYEVAHSKKVSNTIELKKPDKSCKK